MTRAEGVQKEKTNTPRAVWGTQEWGSLRDIQGREAPKDIGSLVLPPLRDKSMCFGSYKWPGLSRYSRSVC